MDDGRTEVAPLSPRIAAMLRRRSYRNYRPEPLPAGAADALRSAIDRAPSLDGARSGYALLIDDPDRAGRLPRAVCSGLVGKINVWLPRTPPPAFIVAAGDSAGGVRDGERHYYNADAAVAAQAAAIEAAGRGVGTCWLGGFHERSVAEVVGLPVGHRPLAVIPIGLPGGASGGSFLTRGWDAAAQRIVSGRRRPLGDMAFLARFGVPYRAERVPREDRGVERSAEAPWPGVGPLRPAAAFSDAPVPAEALDAILECARWAPSAENSQIARHVVVEGPEAVARLLRAASGGAVADPAPAAILSLAAPFIIKARTREQPFFLIDVPIAVTNMLIACEDLGLGWRTTLRFDHAAAAAHVGAPDDHKAVAIVAFGFPAPPGTDPAPAPRGTLGQIR